MSSVRSVAIIGNGPDAWMIAAGLAAGLKGRDCQVTVVPDDQPEPPVLVTLPALRRFHAMIGLEERDLFRHARATYHLGTLGDGGFEPFGALGRKIDGISFHHHWTHMRCAGDMPPLAEFSIAARAAQEGRFAPPDNDPQSPLAGMDYGYHLETAGYTQLLKARGLALGVIQSVIPAEAGIQSRAITSTSVPSLDSRVRGNDDVANTDLIIDTISHDAEQWRDWSPHIPTHEVTYSAKNTTTPAPYTVLSKDRRAVPLQNQTFESTATDTTEPVGHHRQPWTGNRITMGRAAGSLGPHASADLDLSQSALFHLLNLWPSDTGEMPEAAEYNRITRNEWQRALDFETLRYADEADMPETLAHKVRTFRGTARLVMLDGERADQTEWVTRLLARGIVPEHPGALASLRDATQLRQKALTLHDALGRVATSLPTHAEAIEKAKA
ncbi:MAG: tryptophan 7-halogenase [Pacificimonas sp.]